MQASTPDYSQKKERKEKKLLLLEACRFSPTRQIYWSSKGARVRFGFDLFGGCAVLVNVRACATNAQCCDPKSLLTNFLHRFIACASTGHLHYLHFRWKFMKDSMDGPWKLPWKRWKLSWKLWKLSWKQGKLPRKLS